MASPFVRTDVDGNLYAPSGKRMISSDLLSLPSISAPSELADEPDFGGVTVGGSVSGVIDLAGDLDIYSVNLIAGQTYLFSLRGSGATPISDAYLQLVNPAFTAVVAADDDGGNDLASLFTYTATETGSFSLVAQSFPNAGDPGLGGYTVDVRVQGADAVGNTNATSVTIGLGTTFGFREPGSTDVPPAGFLAGDLDRYSVNLVAGQYYTFKLAGGFDYATPGAIPVGELDTFLILRNAAGNILATNDDNGPADFSSTIGFYAVTSGTYYIDATAYAGQTGGYALEVNQVDLSTLDPLDAIDWRNSQDVPFVDVGGVRTAYVYFGAAGENFNQTADDGSPMITYGWQQHEIDAIMLALDQYEAVLGTNYVITTDINQATFRLSTTTSDLYGAYFFPQDPGFGADRGVGVFNIDSGGWTIPGSLDQGGYSFAVILHEFGHAHGLAHPHDRGGGSDIMVGVANSDSRGIFDLNQGVYTVMSYNDAWETHPDGPSSFSLAGIDNGWSGTLSAFDIAQLHARYGSAPASTGNTTYALTDVVNDAFYRTIWDTGGIDTISYGGALNARIDLTAATLDYTPTGGGVVSFLLNVPGLPQSAEVKGGYTIANGVLIENATGGSGNDVLIGNAAANVLTGNAGNDFLLGGAGGDTLNGGEGIDTASYRTSAARVSVDLSGDAAGGDAAGDRLISIENLDGSAFNDELKGNGVDNTLRGLDGNDQLKGEGGNDTLDGGNGNDELDGGSGNDSLSGGAGNDKLKGGIGTDTLNGGDGNDDLEGGSGDDTLAGGAGNDKLTGGLGVDRYLFADAGNDTIVGYQRGEKIDLSALGVTLANVTVSATGIFVDLVGAEDLRIAFATRDFSTADLIFAAPPAAAALASDLSFVSAPEAALFGSVTTQFDYLLN